MNLRELSEEYFKNQSTYYIQVNVLFSSGKEKRLAIDAPKHIISADLAKHWAELMIDGAFRDGTLDSFGDAPIGVKISMKNVDAIEYGLHER